MSVDGQGTKCRRKIAKIYNRLSRVHERYIQTTNRQTIDGRATAYSELEREFTFANKTIGKHEVAESPKIYFIHLCNIVHDLKWQKHHWKCRVSHLRNA